MKFQLNRPGGSLCSRGRCRNRVDRVRIQCGARSVIGPVRDENEDLVFADPDCRLYMVLDGVGGHSGGGEASRIVLDSFRDTIEHHCVAVTCPAQQDVQTALQAALEAAWQAMENLANDNSAYDHMGTVFAFAFMIDNTLLYTHVGDCRVYLFRDQRADQITVDETFVQLMADAGVITADEIPQHPMRNVILNSVGVHAQKSVPALHTADLQPGDRVVLTTDGVTDCLKRSAMERLLAQHEAPQAAADALVEEALACGSRDNASCVVVAFGPSARERHARDQNLHQELAELHETLQNTSELDAWLVDDLKQLAEDIRRALQQQAPSDQVGPLAARLNRLMEALEMKHPRLSAVAGKIAQLLSNLGI